MLDLPGLELKPLSSEAATSKFDLTLFVNETPSGLSGVVEYASSLFDRGTIERMLGHFECLLEGIVAAPGSRVSELPLLTDAERQRILVEWNDTRTDYPRNWCVHELFAEQAAQTPHAVAVAFGEHRLTYAELNARANQLAHYLSRFGVRSGTLVGICAERSLEMIIGLLAILKAGGAYASLAER